jgi:hypothetical protein
MNNGLKISQTRYRHRLNRHRYDHPEATVGEYGVSVFRKIDTETLGNILHATSLAIGNLTLRLRNQPYEKPPAVNLIELRETRRQEALGKMAIDEVVDHIYLGVPSLRKAINITPTDITILGRRRSIERSVALTFNDEDEEKLATERAEILQSLEALPPSPADFNWLKEKQPHLSLARVKVSKIGEIATSQLLDSIFESMPDKIRLKRATIHNPKPGQK